MRATRRGWMNLLRLANIALRSLFLLLLLLLLLRLLFLRLGLHAFFPRSPINFPSSSTDDQLLMFLPSFGLFSLLFLLLLLLLLHVSNLPELRMAPEYRDKKEKKFSFCRSQHRFRDNKIWQIPSNQLEIRGRLTPGGNGPRAFSRAENSIFASHP